ncbi:MAG: ROK family transcriptional regulator [Microbacterium sp.]
MVQGTRELNRRAILTQLLRSRPTSRKEIALDAGISPATVTRAVDELISEGVLFEGDDIVVERRGRRARFVDIVPDTSLALGVDLGASNTRYLLTDLWARPLLGGEEPTPAVQGADELIRWLVGLLHRVTGGMWASIGHVSLGLPGAVGQEDLVVSNAPNLAQVETPGFLEGLLSALAKPLRVDNDANYALLGEQRFGAARDAPNAAMLTLGAGLGAGLAIDGRILQGRHGLVGEFGQLPVGPLGSRLESLVTGPGILRYAAEAGSPIADPQVLFSDAPPNPVATLRAQFDQALLVVLTAISVSCEPSVIVLGGGISKSLAPSLERYEEALRSTIRYAPRLVPASLGDFSGAAGAAVASLHEAYLELGVDPAALTGLPAVANLDIDAVVALHAR